MLGGLCVMWSIIIKTFIIDHMYGEILKNLVVKIENIIQVWDLNHWNLEIS